jgi:hypothetical protein
MQTVTVSRGQGAEFVVAVQEVGDRTEGDGNAAARQFLVDLRDAAVFGVAEASGQGEDIEAELVVRQGEEGLGLRVAEAVVAGTVGVGTRANAQGEMRNGVEGRDSAVFAGADPEAMTTLRAMSNNWREGLGLRGARPATGARHDSPSSAIFLLLF